MALHVYAIGNWWAALLLTGAKVETAQAPCPPRLLPLFLFSCLSIGVGTPASFRLVAAIEKRHEARYRKLLENVQMKQVFEKSGQTMWECRVCGHIVVGPKAPDVCPVCKYSQAYFEVHQEND